MTDTSKAVVVGVFQDHAQADRALAELQSAGFSNNQIGVAGRDWRGAIDGRTEKGTEAEEGGLVGLLAGAGLGGLIGMGVLAGVIPVIGPAIAAGTLGVILTNAAAGAAIAGVVGTLVGMGIPEEEAHYYEEEFKLGRYIVTVKAEGRQSEVLTIFRRNGAVERPVTATHA
jgi:hypothetical protein